MTDSNLLEHRSQPCHGEEVRITQWSYEPCCVRPPKMDRSQWRVLTKHGPLEGGTANHSSILPWKPHEQYEKAKRYDARSWAPLGGGVQYATGEEWRAITNCSWKKEVFGLKRKWLSFVDVSGGETGDKQEMARMNINILGLCELKRKGMGEFNSDDHYIYYCWQESLKRNGVALMVNKSVQNAVLSYSLKNERMILVHFQGNGFPRKTIHPHSNPNICPNH